MSDRTRYLLVCSITSGRNFPERKNSRLVIEGKFNDEILESDPVQQTTAPQVNTGISITRDISVLEVFQFRWLKIKGIKGITKALSVPLIFNHLN